MLGFLTKGAARAALAAALFICGSAQAQTVLQSGPWVPGDAPAYSSSGSGQPIVRDSGVNPTALAIATGCSTTLSLTAGSAYASVNLGIINYAIQTANAVTGAGAIVCLPQGDFYFGPGAIAPLSNVTMVSAGKTNLHYTGTGNAVENVGVTQYFRWLGIGLDAGNGANGVVSHSMYGSSFDFNKYSCQSNASGVFFSLFSDVTTGPHNDAGNYNSAFNDVRNIVMTSPCETGTGLSIAGTGTNSTVTGITTLNTFENINFFTINSVGVNFGHWADSNTFIGQLNLELVANNSTGIIFNSTNDTLRTIYNEKMDHVSIAQYLPLTGTVGIAMGAMREIEISSMFFDDVSHELGTRMTTTVNSTSYHIRVEGSDPPGSEAINDWIYDNNTTNGEGIPSPTSVPVGSWQQIWNNAAIGFIGLHLVVTNLASDVNASYLQVWTVGSTNEATLDSVGNFVANHNIYAPNGGMFPQYLWIHAPLIQYAGPIWTSGFGYASTPSPGWETDNGPAAIDIVIGSGESDYAGRMQLPAAENGWVCSSTDITTQSSSVFITKQSASGSDLSHAQFIDYNTSSVATAWVAGDHLRISCFSY